MLYSSRNNEETSKLNPIVANRIKAVLQEAENQGLEVLITDGYRTAEEQDNLYAQGRTRRGKVVTNAKAGQSFHNYGLAIDFVPVRSDKSLDYGDYETYRKVAEIAKKHGFTWGGDWTKFKDTPHLEYTQGKTVEYFRNGGELVDNTPTWQESARKWAIENKVSNGERPNDTLTRVELWETLRKFSQL